MSTQTTSTRAKRSRLVGVSAGLGLLALSETALAQEIMLTGPLAGAPAVRKQRLRREGRFEVAPTVSFSLLDEYQRQLFVGAGLNYNLTDWAGIGAWGAWSGGPLKITVGLSEHIQEVNQQRQAANSPELNRTKLNLGQDFTKQLGTMDWVFAPQLTLVPFRGKIALFQSVYVDTDLFFFGGPAFVGVRERGDCKEQGCTAPSSFDLQSRVAIAPTFGLGFTFYLNQFMGLSFYWRALPFSRNTGGFDNRGGGPGGRFFDNAVDDKDREFKFNQMLTASYIFYLPTELRVSE